MYYIIYEYRENIPLEKKLIELITDRTGQILSLFGSKRPQKTCITPLF